MPEAPVPGQTVGQSNPAQPAGYNPPATPGPTDHAPNGQMAVDSSGGFMPNGPIPAVNYTPAYSDIAPPDGVDGYSQPGWQTGPPDQGLGVTIGPSSAAPPNNVPGLQAPATGFAGATPLTPQTPTNAPDLWLQTAVASPVQAPRNVAAAATAKMGTHPPQVAMAPIDPQPYMTLRPIVINIVAGQASGLLIGGAGRVVYVFVRESTGAAAASFSLWDGTSASGRLVMPFSLSSGQSSRDNFYPHGIPYYGDLFFTADAGSLTGAIYVVPEDMWIMAEREVERAARNQAVDGWTN